MLHVVVLAVLAVLAFASAGASVESYTGRLFDTHLLGVDMPR